MASIDRQRQIADHLCGRLREAAQPVPKQLLDGHIDTAEAKIRWLLLAGAQAGEDEATSRDAIPVPEGLDDVDLSALSFEDRVDKATRVHNECAGALARLLGQKLRHGEVASGSLPANWLSQPGLQMTVSAPTPPTAAESPGAALLEKWAKRSQGRQRR